MITNEEIIKQADYYLNNEVTMEQAGVHFGVCKKTFQVRMKKLEKIDLDRYKLVQDKKQKNLSFGMIKGGQNGKPSVVNTKEHVLTKDEAVSLANHMLENDLSLRNVESTMDISKSTVFDSLSEENLGEELYKNIKEMFESHKPQNKGK